MKVFIIVLLSVFSLSISAQKNEETKKSEEKKKGEENQKGEKPKADGKTANIEFETTTHDYGLIPFGGDGTYEFVFKNTGKEPLILSNCQSSCGCTIPDCPKTPIAPKQNGSIKVKYNTNRSGPFNKSVTIFSNSPNSPTVLTIKGTVEKQGTIGVEPVKEKSILNNEN